MQNITIHLQPSPELLDSLRTIVRSELANYAPTVLQASTLPELLTRKQAAEVIQVSLTTLNDWAKDTPERSAVLVPFKVGNRVRYRREDVLTAVKESRRFKASKA